MKKSRYDRIINGLFIIMVGLTFLSLFRVLAWLSLVLFIGFVLFIGLHVRDFKKEPQRKRLHIITLIVLINFMLANAVVFISEWIYPY